jgi:hypothetical protein
MLDVGGLSGFKIKTQQQTVSHFLEEEHVTTSTVLPRTPEYKLRTPCRTVHNQSYFSFDSSLDELSSIGGQVPQSEAAQTHIRSPDPISAPSRTEADCGSWGSLQGDTRVTKHPSNSRLVLCPCSARTTGSWSCAGRQGLHRPNLPFPLLRHDLQLHLTDGSMRNDTACVLTSPSRSG